MSLGGIGLAEISLAEISLGEISLGEISLGEIGLGEISLGGSRREINLGGYVGWTTAPSDTGAHARRATTETTLATMHTTI